MSHQKTLKKIETIQRRESGRISMPGIDLCRRRFQRMARPAPVRLSFLGDDGEVVLKGTGTLQNHSAEGAKISHVRYEGDPSCLPMNGRTEVELEIINGGMAGLRARAGIVRAINTGSMFAIRFDCFYINIEENIEEVAA